MNAFNSHILDGKVAVVVGASDGLNLSIARQFAQQGARVVVVSRSEERIAAAAQGMTDEGIGGDRHCR